MTIKSHKGFSLIEMMVYITILVFMLLIIIDVVVSVAKAERIVVAVRNVEGSAISTLERMGREVRASDSIDVANSAFGVDLGVLTLNATDANGTARTVKFSLSGGRVHLMENGVDGGALSLSSTTVTSLILTRFYSSSLVEGVRVQMTLTSGTSTAYRTETFYSSVTLR